MWHKSMLTITSYACNCQVHACRLNQFVMHFLLNLNQSWNLSYLGLCQVIGFKNKVAHLAQACLQYHWFLHFISIIQCKKCKNVNRFKSMPFWSFKNLILAHCSWWVLKILIWRKSDKWMLNYFNVCILRSSSVIDSI